MSIRSAVVSLRRGVLAPRGTVVFIPYLFLLTAQGLTTLLKSGIRSLQVAGGAAVMTVLSLSIISVSYIRRANSPPRDYSSLAEGLERVIQPGDLVIVKNDYVHVPLFYYLDRSYDGQLVHEDHERRISEAPAEARIWLVQTCAEHMISQSGPEDTALRAANIFIGLELWLFQPRSRPGVPVTQPPAICTRPPESTRSENK